MTFTPVVPNEEYRVVGDFNLISDESVEAIRAVGDWYVGRLAKREQWFRRGKERGKVREGGSYIMRGSGREVEMATLSRTVAPNEVHITQPTTSFIISLPSNAARSVTVQTD